MTLQEEILTVRKAFKELIEATLNVLKEYTIKDFIVDSALILLLSVPIGYLVMIVYLFIICLGGECK